MEYLTLDNVGFENFKQAYRNAMNVNAETFVFNGHTILTQYAKYLIEYHSQSKN